MSHTPHELAEEFPEFTDKMHSLKVSDAHFAKLADAYHEINRKVHRAETNVEPIEQLAEDQLRKERASLNCDETGVGGRPAPALGTRAVDSAYCPMRLGRW